MSISTTTPQLHSSCTTSSSSSSFIHAQNVDWYSLQALTYSDVTGLAYIAYSADGNPGFVKYVVIFDSLSFLFHFFFVINNYFQWESLNIVTGEEITLAYNTRMY